MNPMSGFDIRLVFTLPPMVTVHCSTKGAYTSEITFLALNPCNCVSIAKLLNQMESSFWYYNIIVL